MPDKPKNKKEWLTIDEAFPGLMDAALEAEETIFEWELKDFEKEWPETEEGKKWVAFCNSLEWRIGGDDKQDSA